MFWVITKSEVLYKKMWIELLFFCTYRPSLLMMSIMSAYNSLFYLTITAWNRLALANTNGNVHWTLDLGYCWLNNERWSMHFAQIKAHIMATVLLYFYRWLINTLSYITWGLLVCMVNVSSAKVSTNHDSYLLYHVHSVNM